jgi:hypothetical protein
VSAPPPRFFFVHLQKTAGTSLIFKLRRRFGEAAVYPTRADRRAVPDVWLDIQDLRKTFEARRDDVRVVAGHFPLCVSDMLGVPFNVLTVLRDPVERTLSFLRHSKQMEGSTATSLEESYDNPVLIDWIVTNHMVKMLSMTPAEMTAGAMTYLRFEPRHLEFARANLSERIDLFGLQEHFDAFCDEFADRYDLDLGSPIFANRTEPEVASEALRSRIADDNQLDMKLYEYARSLWETRHPHRSN